MINRALWEGDASDLARGFGQVIVPFPNRSRGSWNGGRLTQCLDFPGQSSPGQLQLDSDVGRPWPF
eukprot:3840113-Pyramimonas_sp.AAC.1